MPESLWNRCLRVLESELPTQQFNMWVRPLQAIERNGELKLLAPNRYVIEWVGDHSLPRIKELVREFADGAVLKVVLDVGSRPGVQGSGALNGAADSPGQVTPGAGPPKVRRPGAVGARQPHQPGFHLRQLRRGQEQSAREGGRDSGLRQPRQSL